MVNLAHLPKALQNILTLVASQAGRTSGFLQRQSKLSAEVFLQTLIFGWLANPAASLQQLTQTAALLGTDLSAQALDQRFSQRAANCLRLVLEAAVAEVFAADPVALPLLRRFRRVELIDTSIINLPTQLLSVWAGCGGTLGQSSALKIELGLELLTGTLSGPYLHDGRTHDARGLLASAQLQQGTLRLADLAYFKLSLLKELSQKQVYWITRVKSSTGVVDGQGKGGKLLDFLRACKRERIDEAIELGYQERVECRLLAVKVSQEVANERRRRLRNKARRNGYTIKKEVLEMADWTIYATNVGEEKLSLKEAMVLARARWQIELIFKLWKSRGRIDEWRSQKPWRILCEVYAKLLGMMIQHWVVVMSGWKYADRSLFQAAQVVQMMALPLATAMKSVRQIEEVIKRISQCLVAGCRINKRKKAPSSFQLLSGGALA